MLSCCLSALAALQNVWFGGDISANAALLLGQRVPGISCMECITLLPLTACASEGGLVLPMTREGDRDGWKMGCFSEAEDDGGLLQGIAERV